MTWKGAILAAAGAFLLGLGNAGAADPEPTGAELPGLEGMGIRAPEKEIEIVPKKKKKKRRRRRLRPRRRKRKKKEPSKQDIEELLKTPKDKDTETSAGESPPAEAKPKTPKKKKPKRRWRRRRRKRQPKDLLKKPSVPKGTAAAVTAKPAVPVKEPGAKAAVPSKKPAPKPAKKKKSRRKRKAAPPRPKKEAAPPAPTGPPDERHRNKRYSFKVPYGWRGPLVVDGGVKYASPGGLAFFSIAFYKKGTEFYRSPGAYRIKMREAGSITDPRTLEPVKLSSRIGSRVRYTTPVFGGEVLFGETRRVLYTEEIMVPDPDGIYLITYRARKSQFNKHRLRYLSFLRSLEIPYRRGYKISKYYRERDHILEPLLEADVRPEASPHIATNVLLEERLQIGMGLGTPAGFGFRFFYVLNGKWSAGLVLGLSKIKIGDASESSLGLQTRYFFKDPMQTSWFTYQDLNRVSQDKDGDSGTAFVPGIGIGRQRLWDFWSAEWGLGVRLPTSKQKVPVSLFVSGGWRY